MIVKNRTHFVMMIEHIFKSIWKLIIPIISLIYSSLNLQGTSTSKITNLYITVVILLIMFISMSIIDWFKRVYYIDDDYFYYEHGIFTTIKRKIPIDKIQTIDKTQNIKQKLFNAVHLKMDVGNSTGGKNRAEISIIVSNKIADEINNSIFQRLDDVKHSNSEVLKNKVFTTSLKDLFVTGLTSNAILTGLGFIATVYFFINDYIGSYLDNKLEEMVKYFKHLDANSISTYQVVYIAIIFVIAFILFSLFLSVTGTMVKYYGFRVERNKNSLNIQYGFFNKKNITISVSKIKAMYIEDNIIRQLLGLRSIHIESIGYGDEKGETTVLFPISKRNDSIIDKFLPEFVYEENLIKCNRNALLSYIKINLIIPVILCAGLSYFFKYGYMSLPLVLFSIYSAYLNHKNTGIQIDDKHVIMVSGGINKIKTIVNLSEVQSVSTSSNYFQKKKGLTNYEISIESNKFGKLIKSRYLPLSFKNEFMNIVSKT